ncbi:hypothetical protein BRARA_E01893 [Brassica rapa]|uniref:Uncharacterized protein n=1 Tax=Brassica campestris TaxID=3711 RepID=A0A397ZBL8_BRACM|nr:hypothetical protein BRARA_E01893 [Brassica rapa]
MDLRQRLDCILNILAGYRRVNKQTGGYSYNNTRLTPMIEFMFNYNKFLQWDTFLFDYVN